MREDDDGFQSFAVLSEDGFKFWRPHTREGQSFANLAWPPGIESSAAAGVNAEWEARLARAASVPVLLRTVAGAFDYGRGNGRSMSDEVEIGLTLGALAKRRSLYLRRPVAGMLSATDDELLSALTDPPSLPPFGGLEAERTAFTWRKVQPC